MDRSIEQLFIEGKVKTFQLTAHYTFKPFNCGNADLNHFLVCKAKNHLKYLRYKTIIIETVDKIIAYYCLSNDLLKITDMEDFKEEMELAEENIHIDYWHSFLNETEYPAVKIGCLAVDEEFQNKGIGTFIINSIVESFIHNNKTGCQFITIDAINNPDTLRFYNNNGFKHITLNDIQKESRQMFKSLLEYI